MKLGKRWTVAACASLLGMTAAAVGCGAPGGASGGDSNSVLIGTAGEGGTYFYVGQGMARALDKNTDLAATSQGTAGGTENLRRLSTGDMDVAFAAPADLERVIEDGTADVSKMRILMSGHGTVSHVAVRADSDITSLDQLFVEGRRIGVGEPGSNVQNMSIDLLEIFGLTMKDIKPSELAQSDQAKALQNKELDGAVLGGGIPLAAASEIGTNVGVRILPVPDDVFAEIKKVDPAQYQVEIPAGTYKGTDEAVPSYAYPSLIIVRSDMSEDQAYQITKTILEQHDQIAKVHPSGAEYTLDNAFRSADYYTQDLGLKFHPGAVKYYNEKDAWEKKYE